MRCSCLIWQIPTSLQLWAIAMISPVDLSCFLYDIRWGGVLWQVPDIIWCHQSISRVISTLCWHARHHLMPSIHHQRTLVVFLCDIRCGGGYCGRCQTSSDAINPSAMWSAPSDGFRWCPACQQSISRVISALCWHAGHHLKPSIHQPRDYYKILVGQGNVNTCKHHQKMEKRLFSTYLFHIKLNLSKFLICFYWVV